MTSVDTRLDDLLGPVRDLHVAVLLETMARELGAGAEVDAEPVERDADGRIRRSAPLGLPRRHDLRVAVSGNVLLRGVEAGRALRFEPVSVGMPHAGSALIAPFDWGAAGIRVRYATPVRDWTPVRRWFLEWFQARYGDESPDLLGAIHALEGPEEVDGDFRFTIDFGSASVAAFVAMIEAFAQTGCAGLRVGETEDAIRRNAP
jgi:hypothetical protein